MGKKYCYKAADGTLYYHIPIEAFRGLIDNATSVFYDIGSLFASDCDNEEELSECYGVRIDDFENGKKHGEEISKKITSEVYFSTTKKAFWRYKCKVGDGQLNPNVIRELHIWLCYMAINSIGGRSRVKKITNYVVLLRAAGYVSPKDYIADGRINKAYHLPAKKTELPDNADWGKYSNRIKGVMERRRLHIMERWDNMHFYSEAGMRGFLCMNEETERVEALKEMARYAKEKKRTAADRRKEYKQMMEEARKEANKT